MSRTSTPTSLKLTALSGLLTASALLSNMLHGVPSGVPGCLIVGAVATAFSAVVVRERQRPK